LKSLRKEPDRSYFRRGKRLSNSDTVIWVTPDKVKKAVMGQINRGSHTGEILFAPDAKRVIEFAVEEARILHHQFVGPEHLLIGIVREKTGLGGRILRGFGLDEYSVRREVLQILGELPPQESVKYAPTPNLDRFSRDLTQMAREGKLDPVIGREKEMFLSGGERTIRFFWATPAWERQP